jgi:hypothetical protein
MEATLKFNLPEERDDHVLAIKASNMYGALWDINEYLRKIQKYMDKTPDIEEIREKFYEILDDNSFSLEEVS